MLSQMLMGGNRPRTAPVYVGGYSTSFDGTASTTNVSLTSLTGGLASAPAANDIVVVAYAVSSELDASLSVSGYATLADLYGNDSREINLTVAWKLMESTPDTSITCSSTGGINRPGSVQIHVWRGQDLSVPWDVSAKTATGTNSSVVNPAAITPMSPGTILLVAGASATDADNVLTAGYLSNFITASRAQVYYTSCGMGSVAWTSGSYDPAVWGSTSDSIADSWASLTMALRGV